MSSCEIVWEVPEPLYRQLEWAREELAYPKITDLIAQAVQRYMNEIRDVAWEEEFRQLQKDVRSAGGLDLGETKEEVVERLRKQRQEIFEAEYAHLYR